MSEYLKTIDQLKDKLSEVIALSKQKDSEIFKQGIGINYFKEQIEILKGKIEYYENKINEKPKINIDMNKFLKQINEETQKQNGYSDKQINNWIKEYEEEYKAIKPRKK